MENMNYAARLAMVVSCAGVAVLGSGCAAFRQDVTTVDVDKSKPMSASYDYTDLRSMTDEIAVKLLDSDAFKKPATPPIVAIFDVQNNTTLHIDTLALTDTLRRKMMESNKAKFVNTARRDQLLKEQEYQGRNATAETRTAVGRQLGAKYMITGALAELKKKTGRQVRVSEKEEIYYQLTIEVTDLETGLVEAAPQVERARKESRPIIGW
jgi:penicillin-binding protein activator